MASKFQKVLAKVILTPCSYIYKGIVVVRNLMFNAGLLKQREFDVPVVVVGNLAVGGTGKTPHTEYIVSRLLTHYKSCLWIYEPSHGSLSYPRDSSCAVKY